MTIDPSHIQTVRRPVRIGFVPLIDAAPLILAQELHYFADEGLQVELCREVGWANVRDKVAFGQLNASHALLGLPIQAALDEPTAGPRMISVLSLGAGGDCITLAERLIFSGVNSAGSLGKFVRQSQGKHKPVFAHVFGCSMHHYLLRDWLASGGLNPDDDVKLCVLPPPQMAGHMASGHLDGFCVGEPWNLMAQKGGCGRIVALTTDILPDHPEKILAVNRKWATAQPDLLVPMIRAILRAGVYCSDPKNYSNIATLLSQPKYLNLPADALLASLMLDRSFGLKAGVVNHRADDWQMRSFTRTFPSMTHFAWLMSEMQRWQHAPAHVDPFELARRCVDTQPYRTAAASLGINCPENDFPPMPLRRGTAFAQSSFGNNSARA